MIDQTQQNNYDVLFNYINIIPSDGKPVNIINQFVHIDIFESILSPVIMCNIVINDSLNMLENIPLIMKKSFVEMEYKTPKVEGGALKRRFIINEVGNRVYDPQLKRSTYTLQCLSEEVIPHSNHIITKVVTGSEIG